MTKRSKWPACRAKPMDRGAANTWESMAQVRAGAADRARKRALTQAARAADKARAKLFAMAEELFPAEVERALALVAR